jgi:DNA-binding transcriptional LysR family regulator
MRRDASPDDHDMKQFEFSTLRVFVAVAKGGSLSAAADQLHLAIAAISKRIADLEDSVGAKLFHRHGRGVALTPAGETLLQHAQELLFGVERMRADISEFSRGVKGNVRVAATTSAVTQYLPGELKRFAAKFPRLRIDLREQTSREGIAALMDGHVELAIVSEGTTPPDIETHGYHVDRLCLVVPAAHGAARRNDIALAAAIKWDFVGLRAGSSLMSLLTMHAGGPIKLRVQVTSFDAMCQMVEAELGVGVLPEHAARTHARSMKIHVLPLSDAWAARPLVIAVRSSDALTVPARSLLMHLASNAAPRSVHPKLADARSAKGG